MNTHELGKSVTVTEEMFESDTSENGFLKKLIAKKWLILRRTFLFGCGFTYCLIYL